MIIQRGPSKAPLRNTFKDGSLYTWWEDEDGIIPEPRLFKCVRDVADGFVHTLHHSRVNASGFIGYVVEFPHVLLRDLEREMDGLECVV